MSEVGFIASIIVVRKFSTIALQAVETFYQERSIRHFL
jgi:hypothetical protein